jgi:glycosyltransferase involved in cell wall biosynthesis
MNPAREWREILKNREALGAHDTDTAHPPGFTVYEPEFWLPKLYRPQRLADFTFQLRLKRARNLLVRRGCQKIILYVWRPEYAPALLSVPVDLSCYHIDDEYSFSDVDVPLDEAEGKLIAKVDQVFIHSPGLLEKKGRINPHTAFVPNGVDYEAYAKPAPEPPDLAPIPHPRIGYSGVLKRTLNWPLMHHLIEQHPGWSFVFVGRPSPHPEVASATQELANRRNVYFLGAKSAQDLAVYPQHFDVCIMPYRLNSHMMKYGYPLKLHEYLASGRPTVGSPIRTLREFNNVVSLANTPDEWSVAIARALGPEANTAGRRATRQAVAQRHDWDLLVLQVARTMAQRLGQEFAERLALAHQMRREPSLLGKP